MRMARLTSLPIGDALKSPPADFVRVTNRSHH